MRREGVGTATWCRDVLIDEHGRIVEAYYGGDAGDRIPMERIELFLARGLLERGVPVAKPA